MLSRVESSRSPARASCTIREARRSLHEDSSPHVPHAFLFGLEAAEGDPCLRARSSRRGGAPQQRESGASGRPARDLGIRHFPSCQETPCRGSPRGAGAPGRAHSSVLGRSPSAMASSRRVHDVVLEPREGIACQLLQPSRRASTAPSRCSRGSIRARPSGPAVSRMLSPPKSSRRSLEAPCPCRPLSTRADDAPGANPHRQPAPRGRDAAFVAERGVDAPLAQPPSPASDRRATSRCSPSTRNSSRSWRSTSSLSNPLGRPILRDRST